MTVRNIVKGQTMRRSPICSPGMSVFDAAVEIAALDVNALAVVDDGALLGIITDKDIIVCLADSGGEFYNQTVAVWMTEKPVTCALGAKLSTALNLMAKYDVRDVVVKKGDQVITVVSSTEILKQAHERDELMIKVLRDLARPLNEAFVA